MGLKVRDKAAICCQFVFWNITTNCAICSTIGTPEAPKPKRKISAASRNIQISIHRPLRAKAFIPAKFAIGTPTLLWGSISAPRREQPFRSSRSSVRYTALNAMLRSVDARLLTSP
jgi:hypothetical protein